MIIWDIRGWSSKPGGLSRYVRYCDKETLNSNKPNQTKPGGLS